MTFAAGLKKTSILKKKRGLSRLNSYHVNASSRLIGDQMTKLFKDDHLYEKGLIDNPNFKLLSLRDFSAMDINKLAGSEEEQKVES